jgi:hypothetical protein
MVLACCFGLFFGRSYVVQESYVAPPASVMYYSAPAVQYYSAPVAPAPVAPAPQVQYYSAPVQAAPMVQYETYSAPVYTVVPRRPRVRIDVRDGYYRYRYRSW